MNRVILCLFSIFLAASVSAQSIRLEPAITGLDLCVYLTGAGDGTNRIFLLEKNAGRIRIFQDGKPLPRPFLDIGGWVSTSSEQGLLGLAFHPEYKKNRRFFIYYTNRNGQGDSVLSEFRCSPDDPNFAKAEERVLLSIKQPYENHNGGQIAFGPDGYLYVGLGDGGAANDPKGHGQNIETLPGSILRIDVNSTSTLYNIPPDNPFAGAIPGRDEIYCYGIRNAWRFSFDRGGEPRLFCGDVGQNRREEIDIIVKGGNYGWNIMEGMNCFRPPTKCDQSGLILPIHDYEHRDGHCSVTGGYVYRGKSAPALVGKYIYADYCSGFIWALEETSPGKWKNTNLYDAPFAISSFGEDDAGELYVIEYLEGTRTGSRAHRIVAKE